MNHFSLLSEMAETHTIAIFKRSDSMWIVTATRGNKEGLRHECPTLEGAVRAMYLELNPIPRGKYSGKLGQNQ